MSKLKETERLLIAATDLLYMIRSAVRNGTEPMVALNDEAQGVSMRELLKWRRDRKASLKKIDPVKAKVVTATKGKKPKKKTIPKIDDSEYLRKFLYEGDERQRIVEVTARNVVVKDGTAHPKSTLGRKGKHWQVVCMPRPNKREREAHRREQERTHDIIARVARGEKSSKNTAKLDKAIGRLSASLGNSISKSLIELADQ